jgi:hypothetical protein
LLNGYFVTGLCFDDQFTFPVFDNVLIDASILCIDLYAGNLKGEKQNEGRESSGDYTCKFFHVLGNDGSVLHSEVSE